MQHADLELALARCGVFACYWGLAAQVLGPLQRSQVEAAIRDAALLAELPMALPLGGSLASWLVSPRRGTWIPWTSIVPGIAADRAHGVIPVHMQAPVVAMASRQGARGAGAEEGGVQCPQVEWHYYRDPRTGCMGLFVPNAATQALQYCAQLALQAGMHPMLVGPAGSGRRTLLLHLLSTVQMQRLRTQVGWCCISTHLCCMPDWDSERTAVLAMQLGADAQRIPLSVAC